MERIQPSRIVLLLVHRPADLLRRQSMPPGTAASSRASSSVCDIFCMILSPSGSSRMEEGHALLFFRGKIPLFFLPHRLEILL